MSDGGTPGRGRGHRALSPEQVAQVMDWYEKVRALGSRKQVVYAAIKAWRKARSDLGPRWQWARKFNAHPRTVDSYIMRNKKP